MAALSSSAPPRQKYVIQDATPADAPAIADVVVDAFANAPLPQAAFLKVCFPDAAPTRRWIETSIAEQMRREPRSLFRKVCRPGSDGEMLAFAKWSPPPPPAGNGTAEHAWWADFADGMDVALCGALFGSFAANRAALLGDRPHWYLELLAVGQAVHRQGVGAALVAEGCAAADADGVECYVDASPAGRGLYIKHGFVERNREAMPAPYEWYEETFLVRDARAKK